MTAVRSTAAKGSRLLRVVSVTLALLAVVIAYTGGSATPSGRSRLVGAADTSAVSSGSAAGVSANPVANGHGGIRNVTFYYAGRIALRPGANLARLGSPSIVVANPKAHGRAAVRAIHSIGAKAYRYVQFYWAPNDRRYEGINLVRHPRWAFCRTGNKRIFGRITPASGHREKWYFIDANERPVRAAVRYVLTRFKAQGWDGVIFDRGQAATQFGQSANGKPVWDARSSCTQHPYNRRATFSDAYVHLLGLAHQVGLKVLFNNGISPFDPQTPMRPDPRNPACQAHRWGRCRYLPDVWPRVDLVLNESGVAPRTELWHHTFVANRSSELNARHGGRTVMLITTVTLGGASHQTRRNVFYEWSRIKLFNLAVAVNTGDGGCGDSVSSACNRYGVYPDLVDVRFGAPTSNRPTASRCTKGTVRCVWSRRYARGVNLLNASARPRHRVRVRVTGSACRYVYDVFERRPLAHNHCVHRVTLRLGRWTGRPLTFSRKPHV